MVIKQGDEHSERGAVEDLRTLAGGDPTVHWIPKEPVVTATQERSKEQLQGAMEEILRGLPEALRSEAPSIIATPADEYAVVVRGVHRKVVSFAAYIRLRFYRRVKTLEATVVIHDGVYSDTDRYNDRNTWNARSKEELEQLVFEVGKYLRSRMAT